MPYIPKLDAEWLKAHGEQGKGGWVCRKTGEPINQMTVGRSIHIAGMMGGFGEVRDVMHLYCTGCNPDFKPPAHGTPIQEDDLVRMY